MTTENDNCDGAELILRLVATDGVVAGHSVASLPSVEPRERYVVDPAELAAWRELDTKPDVAQEQARMRRRNAKTIGL